MIKMDLYTGNGISLSPQNAEGRTTSPYVRIIADDGMGITNGNTVTTCVDVLAENIGLWSDCELPEDDTEATAEDYEAALGRFGV